MKNKSVLISIRPKWCEMIANGDKTVEVRKTRPKLEPPFKCYIYCTQQKRPYDDFISFVAEDGLWHLEVPCGADIGIRFCPMCGRRLPQPPKGE